METEGEGEPELTVLDPGGAPVARGRGRQGTLRVADPRLWEPWPGTPELYTLEVRFGADLYRQTFGFREIRVEGTRVLLNGKPLYFKGCSKHEDSAFHGRGLDPCLNVKDAGLLHWLGANAVRTSHYPYSEEFYDLCDREGVLVIDETPAVGIGAGGGPGPLSDVPHRGAPPRRAAGHDRPGQKPPLRGHVEPGQRAGPGAFPPVRLRLLAAAVRAGPRAGPPGPPGNAGLLPERLYQGHHHPHDGRGLPEPLLRLVQPFRRPGRRLPRLAGGTGFLGAAGQARHVHRVRRGYHRGPARHPRRDVQRGIPGRIL